MTSFAQSLPYHILVECFSYTVEQNEAEWTHGGRLIGWDSNEAIRSMAGVCRGWEDAAQTVLHTSVAILGANAANAFLRTAEERPDLMEKVRSLVVGLGEMEESTDVEMGQAALSLTLVKVIEACPFLEHLQVRPLHESSRQTLIPVILSKSLLSLVCAPRLVKPHVGWTRQLYHSTDVQLALPTLTRLELDFWAAAAPLPNPLPILPPLNLVELRLHCDLPDELLHLLLAAAGPSLHIVDLYFERVVSVDHAAAALMHSTRSMKNLRYISNPTLDELSNFNSHLTPVFDRLLPHYIQLERLFISATDISTNLLRLLPPCLRDLDIQSFNHHGLFAFSQSLILALQDDSLLFSLETLTVHDATEVWEEENVDAMRETCRSRGIEFYFRPDSEGAESD